MLMRRQLSNPKVRSFPAEGKKNDDEIIMKK